MIGVVWSPPTAPGFFRNPAATDKAKEALYLFYTPIGNFIAANHTGQ